MIESSDRTLPAEFRVIERYFARHGVRRNDVVLGIGDDAAVCRLDDTGVDLVTATDLLVEQTHFLPGASARSIGHRSLAVNISDFAAMGATPAWVSLGLSLPQLDDEWLEEFAAGLFALAQEHDIALIGGDTVRGPLSIAVTLQGTVPRDAAIRRSGALPGDLIYVTGEPGCAASGRLFPEAGLAALSDSDRDVARYCLAKFEYPQPRLAEGLTLHGLASAMIDLSDGLRPDLEQLLRASDLGARIDVAALPLDAVLQLAQSRAQALALALDGGEDYELLFTVPPANVAELHELAADWSCGLSCIGAVRPEPGIDWCDADVPLEPTGSGFAHFPESSP